MNASDTTVILTKRADGGLTVHDAKTGRVIGQLPPGAVAVPKLDPLDEQMRATTIRQKRELRANITTGLVFGIAVVTGVVIGLLLSYL